MNDNINNSWLRGLLFVLLIPVFTFASGSEVTTGSRVITAAILNDFPPLYSRNKSGVPEGFAIDILENVAQQSGLTIEYLHVENWAAAMQAVRSNQADLIPGIGISSVRSEEFLFTEKIETIPVSCFVRSSNHNIKGIDSLPGHRVAVIDKSAAETRLSDMSDIELVRFQNIDSALFQLMAGDVDAFVFPEPVLKKKMYIMNLGNDYLKVVGKPLMELKRGFLMRKTDELLAKQLNSAINIYTHSNQYLIDYQKWYGKAQPFWNVRRVFIAMSFLLFLLLVSLLGWRFFTLKTLNERLMKSTDERETAYKALQQTQKQQMLERSLLTSMLNSIPDLIFYKNNESVYLGCNQAFEDFIGHKQSELIDHTDLDFFAKDMADVFRKRDQQMLASGEAQRNEEWVNYPDGRLVLLDTLKTPYLSSDGKTLGLIGISRDITERKKAEYSLHRSETLLREAQAMAHIGNWELNPETMKVVWSDEVFQILGIDATDCVSPELLASVIHPEDRDDVLSSLTCAQKGNHKHHMEYRIIRPDGETRWIDCQANQVFDKNNNAISLRGVIQDITDRKKGEHALRRAQKMDAIGQLTGGIAHDFNNLLSIIIGNLDFLKRLLAEDEKSLKRVNSASKASLRAADLTKQLLGFSRRHSQEKHPCDINQIILAMDSLIARSVTPEVEVELQLNESPWLTQIDPGDFEDALVNLILNARDAMPQGGNLTIETVNKQLDSNYTELNPGVAPGDYLQLAVSDTGGGIANENIEHIFEPFFTTKPADKGTGLGLSMVYGFVQRSGGYIKAYSEKGIGTTFRLYLPRSAEQRKEPGETLHENNIPLQRNETILIVDDEVDLLDLAKDYLEEIGCRVYTASRGAEALAILESNPSIDLLFSDVVMPGRMNGYELAEQACEKHPHLKVLLTSGFTKKVAAKKGQDRIIAKLLTKPYSRENLIKSVKELLDG